jgi:hypothetical protein
MDSKIKVSQVFSNNPQESRLRGQPKTDVGTVCKQILIDSKLKTGQRKQKMELTRSPLRRERTTLNFSAI